MASKEALTVIFFNMDHIKTDWGRLQQSGETTEVEQIEADVMWMLLQTVLL